ncbi:MAG: tRNA dihydrouridine synthase DusB [Pseudobdellovibrionaceae bacterium]
MAGITDFAFRSFMKKLDASVVVTELISATGIEYKSERTIQLMKFDDSQRPIGIQLFGEDPQILARAARFAQEQGCDFVDLNFGCPVPKVVKKGGGSAILKDLVQLQKVLSTVKAAIDIPLTIKIRTGWDQNTRNATEVCNIAFNEGITWVAIHGRTRAQGYAGLSDWDYIAEVKSRSRLPILGNGDIHSAEHAMQKLTESGCDGVLIGRGCLKNPLIFQQAYRLWQKQEVAAQADFNLDEIYKKLKLEMQETYSEQILSLQLKKFASWFSAGYPGAAAFRKEIFQMTESETIFDRALNFFQNIKNSVQLDTSREGFLMGGHG